jgi:hypothetical protein
MIYAYELIYHVLARDFVEMNIYAEVTKGIWLTDSTILKKVLFP